MHQRPGASSNLFFALMQQNASVSTSEWFYPLNSYWIWSSTLLPWPQHWFWPHLLMDGGAWWAAVHGVAKSRTRLRDFTFTFHFHALEKEMAAHSNILAWRIPGMGEPGGLPCMGSHRVRHDQSNLATAEAAALTRAIARADWLESLSPPPIFPVKSIGPHAVQSEHVFPALPAQRKTFHGYSLPKTVSIKYS